MKVIQLEVTLNDIAVLESMSRLIENNRDKLGKDYLRALELSKKLKKQADSINSKQYERKINSSTLIYDSK